MSSNFDLDYGSIISDNILSSPFTYLIDQMAERDGLNSKDMRRKATALGGSALMGGFIGATLGGPLGFIMGLMGYAAGMAVRFEDEDKEEYVMEAAIRAGKRLRQYAPDDVVDDIYDDLMDFINTYDTDQYSAKESLEILYKIMVDVDPKAANLWVVLLKDEL